MAKFVTPSLRPHLLKSVAALKLLNIIDEPVKRDVDLTTYRFGLSTLHVWIRLFEGLVHISYRLEYENGMYEREKINESYKIKTKTIQHLFKIKWVF